jgi:predicted MFS family arabinose efflux permease
LTQTTLPTADPSAGAETAAPSAAMVFFLAASCGIIVANIYYSQPLVGLIAPAIGLGKAAASFIVALTQLGYAAGLLALVPLGDIVENRLLLIATVAASIPALLIAGFAGQGSIFLAASALIGVTSVAVQMLLPLAAHLAPDHQRGRIVGNVMSGLLAGILLARPVASLIAHSFGWRTVFFASAGLMAAEALALRLILPRRPPSANHHYFELLRSLLALPFTTPVLRRRSAYQAAAFGGFSLFWTATPLLLAQKFAFTQNGIAVFALVGAAGALAAPIAGRLADRNFGRPGTVVALLSIVAAFLLAAGGGAWHSVIALAAGVQPARDLCPGAGNALAPQRRFHGHLFRRRRCRIGAGQPGPHPLRLAGHLHHRYFAPAFGTALFQP